MIQGKFYFYLFLYIYYFYLHFIFIYFFHSCRRELQSIGAKLIFLSLMDFIKSTVFVIPILMLLAEIGIVIRNINEKKITMQSIVQIAKSTLLLFLIGVALRIIGMLPGVSITALLLGGIAIFVSMIEPVLKHLTPYIAPNITTISIINQQIDRSINFSSTFLQKNNKALPMPQPQPHAQHQAYSTNHRNYNNYNNYQTYNSSRVEVVEVHEPVVVLPEDLNNSEQFPEVEITSSYSLRESTRNRRKKYT